MRQCICCLEEKPESSFSKQPTNSDGLDKTCKQCRSEASKARAALRALDKVVGPSEWPENVKAYVSTCQTRKGQGAKIPRFAESLIEELNIVAELGEEDLQGVDVSAEAFYIMQKRLETLEYRVGTLERSKTTREEKQAEKQKEIARVQRLDNLAKEVYGDMLPFDVMGETEYNIYLRAIKSVVGTIKIGTELPAPSDLMAIMGQINDFGMQLPDSLAKLYYEVIKPYVGNFKDSAEFAEMVSRFPDGLNLYDEDWVELSKA